MTNDLFSSSLEIFEVPFPKFFKKVLRSFKDPLKEPITAESLKLARDSENKLGKGLLKLIIHGVSPKLASVVNRNNENYHIRIYTPISKEPMPVIIYYHGGGYVLGSVESSDPICRKMAKDLDIIVLDRKRFENGIKNGYDYRNDG